MTGRLSTRIVCMLLFAGFFAAGGARAAVIAVDGTTCTLANAILSANDDTAVGGCTAGAGADTLILGADVVLSVPMTSPVEGGPSGLPEIASWMTIAAGGGAVVERSSALPCGQEEATAFRLFTVSTGGILRLSGLTLRNGCIAPVSIQTIASGGAVLVGSGGELRLEDCALTDNAAVGGDGSLGPDGEARGGAVAVLGGRLTILSSSFSGNRALGNSPRGGAVAVESGDLTLATHSRFIGNRASSVPNGVQNIGSEGGGLAFRDAEVGTLSFLEISGNISGTDNPGLGAAATGGGLAIAGGFVREIRDSHFNGNVARAGSFSPVAGTPARGGGLANAGRIDTIARTTFADNQALGYSGGEGRGGGLDNTGRIGRIVASSFFANTAAGGLGFHAVQGPSLGGGIANLGSIAEIAASSFAGNECPGFIFIGLSAGGGIYNASDDVAPDEGLRLVDTLLASNLATDGADCFSTADFVSFGFNLAQAPDVSCLFGSPGDIVGEDPQLLGPADNGCTVPLPGGGCAPTVAFSATSPAADAGLCSAAGTEIDARGAVRPFDLAGVPNAAGGDGCDIGAFELAGGLAAVHLGLNVADSADPVGSGSGPGNLSYTVALASLGSATASGIAVSVPLSLPPEVAFDSATASLGSWDGATWTVPSLPSGGQATLTLVLTVGLGTSGGTDVLSLSAAVTAATGHSGEFATDVERTSVIEGIFFDAFESGDTSAWSLTVGGS